MKIVIFGGTGFIGRNLKEYFQNNTSYDVDCPTRQQLNLLDEKAVDDYLRNNRPDVLINAAICRNPKYFVNNQAESELAQDLRMFHILEKRQDLYGKLLYFGSGAEYGKQNPIVSVREEDLTGDVPLNDYGLAKYTIGKAIENSRNIYNLRIFGLFGKYENWKTTFISGACCKALNQLPITIRQNVFFDYLYIDDFCKIIHWFVDNTPKHKTYNVSSGRKIDLQTLANIVISKSGYDVPVYVCKPGYGVEYTANNQRLLDECKSVSITDIESSIEDLLEYYKSIKDEIDILSLLYPGG
ncbi:MAG: NAD(P)-dependent oxidoreductase [Lachnospiraceae bacterium]|nr:NAD(P)-dependent oxidoreductase [Lachnospiraceae bacterium]